jgi:hypothetical protein
MKSGYFHFNWVFSLFFLKGASNFLLKFNPYGFRMSEWPSIWVVLFLLFLLSFPISKLKAIFMTFSMILLSTSCWVCLVITLIKVKVSAKFRGLSLPEIELGINTAGCWFIESAVWKNIRRVCIKWTIWRLSCSSCPLEVQWLIECVSWE